MGEKTNLGVRNTFTNASSDQAERKRNGENILLTFCFSEKPKYIVIDIVILLWSFLFSPDCRP